MNKIKSFENSLNRKNLMPVQKSFLNKAVQVVKTNLSNPQFNVEVFSREMGLSRSQLHRKLIDITGQPASWFISHFRLLKAVKLMKQGITPLSYIAQQTGFHSPSYFRKCFIKVFGVTPSKFDLNTNNRR